MEIDEPHGNSARSDDSESLAKRIIIVSYFSGTPGFSPSEWVQDKLRCARELNQEVILITTIASVPLDLPGLKLTVLKVPSISWRDLKYEGSFLRQHGLSRTAYFFMLPLSLIFGVIFDFLFKAAAGNHSDGKWGWTLTSFPVIFLASIFNPRAPILATGGPSVAQFVCALNSRILNRKLLVEFQDPFFGSEMSLSGRARKVIRHTERFIIAQSLVTVYVTQGAAAAARGRYPDVSKKITYCYPGAWNYIENFRPIHRESSADYIEFLHVGTLYGTRNLDLFFEAIDFLLEQGTLREGKYKVVNLGGVHVENLNKYLQRVDFQQLQSVDRLTALERAHTSNFLLLVQHTDSRSLETIPFKTYDYLNVGHPIVGMLNNSELSSLIENANGFPAQADSLDSIIGALESAISLGSPRSKNARRRPIDAISQWKNLLRLLTESHATNSGN